MKIDWQLILKELESAGKVELFEGKTVRSSPTDTRFGPPWSWQITLKDIWTHGSAVFLGDRDRALKKAKEYVEERQSILAEVRASFGPGEDAFQQLFAKIWNDGYDSAMQSESANPSLAQDNPFE